mgnify:CR=1 FL=1
MQQQVGYFRFDQEGSATGAVKHNGAGGRNGGPVGRMRGNLAVANVAEF